jgi:hypothetical protein
MRYEVSTALTPQEVFERASAHFGPQGFGLEITSHDESCLVFEGGGLCSHHTPPRGQDDSRVGDTGMGPCCRAVYETSSLKLKAPLP